METNKELITDAQVALQHIRDRIALTHRICCGMAPKQAVGEGIAAIEKMPEWETVTAALSQRSEAVPSLDEALNDSDQVPYLIHFDDPYRQPELVIGGTRARYRFEQISSSWNAHLYVKIKSNSRDDKYPSANLAAPSAAAGGQVLLCHPDITKRIRSIVDLLGLQSDIPEDDLTGYEWAVLGLVRSEIARLKAAAQPTPAQGDAVPVADPPYEFSRYSLDYINKRKPELSEQEVAEMIKRGWAGYEGDIWRAATRQSSADAVDAARYRWLRNPNQDVALVIDKVSDDSDAYGSKLYEYRAGDELDAAIDAASAAQGGKGEKE